MEENLQTRLLQARKEAGKTQPQVADHVGMSQPAYSELERGLSQGSQHMPQIAEYLGVNALWIIEGKEPKHPSGRIDSDSSEATNNEMLQMLAGLSTDSLSDLSNDDLLTVAINALQAIRNRSA
ncbi:MAG: helix-turn-helix transcriptional regulator [Pseudomonadota bacterium]